MKLSLPTALRLFSAGPGKKRGPRLRLAQAEGSSPRFDYSAYLSTPRKGMPVRLKPYEAIDWKATGFIPQEERYRREEYENKAQRWEEAVPRDQPRTYKGAVGMSGGREGLLDTGTRPFDYFPNAYLEPDPHPRYPFKAGDSVYDTNREHWTIVEDYEDGTYAVRSDSGHLWHLPGYELTPAHQKTPDLPPDVRDPLRRIFKDDAPHLSHLGEGLGTFPDASGLPKTDADNGDAEDALKTSRILDRLMDREADPAAKDGFQQEEWAKARLVRRIAARLVSDPDFQTVADTLRKEWAAGDEVLQGYRERPGPEAAVHRLVKTWAATSHKNELAACIQAAAEEEFNLYGIYERNDVSKVKRPPAFVRGVRKFLRTMYNETQETLKALGMDSVYLYRGFRWEVGNNADWHISVFEGPYEAPYEDQTHDPDDEDDDTCDYCGKGLKVGAPYFYNDAMEKVVCEPCYEAQGGFPPDLPDLYFDMNLRKANVRLQPLSSFAATMDSVHHFTGDKDEEPGAFSHSLYVAARVPRERVLSFAYTGFGCLSEKEFVVLGGTLPFRYVGKDWGENPYQYATEKDFWGQPLGTEVTTNNPLYDDLRDESLEKREAHYTDEEALAKMDADALASGGFAHLSAWADGTVTSEKTGKCYAFDKSTQQWHEVTPVLEAVKDFPRIDDPQALWLSMEYVPSAAAWYNTHTHAYYRLYDYGGGNRRMKRIEMPYPPQARDAIPMRGLFLMGTGDWLDPESGEHYRFQDGGLHRKNDEGEYIDLAAQAEGAARYEGDDDPEARNPLRTDVYPIWKDMVLYPSVNAWWDEGRRSWLRPNPGQGDSMHEIKGWGDPARLDDTPVPATDLRPLGQGVYEDEITKRTYQWEPGTMPAPLGAEEGAKV